MACGSLGVIPQKVCGFTHSKIDSELILTLGVTDFKIFLKIESRSDAALFDQ